MCSKSGKSSAEQGIQGWKLHLKILSVRTDYVQSAALETQHLWPAGAVLHPPLRGQYYQRRHAVGLQNTTWLNPMNTWKRMSHDQGGGASEPLHPEQNTSAALRGMNRALGGIYGQPSKRTAQWCPSGTECRYFSYPINPRLTGVSAERHWPGGGRITPPRLTPKPMTQARRARRRWKGLGETVLKHS